MAVGVPRGGELEERVEQIPVSMLRIRASGGNRPHAGPRPGGGSCTEWAEQW